MTWREIALDASGLLIFPGLLAAVAVGILLEIAAEWTLGQRRSLASAALRTLAPLRRGNSAIQTGADVLRRPLPLALAALLTAVAGIQLAAPYSPISPGDRNLLTGAIALLGAGWLPWLWRRAETEMPGHVLLTAQLAWLVALLVPVVIPQTLKPQTLGYVTLNPVLPVKVACAMLYVLCLPILLRLLPRPAPTGPGLERLLLWLPYCGLFASLFFVPGGDSPIEVIRFLGLVAGAAILAVALALLLIRAGADFSVRFYRHVVVSFAWLTLALGMLTAALSSR